MDVACPVGGDTGGLAVIVKQPYSGEQNTAVLDVTEYAQQEQCHWKIRRVKQPAQREDRIRFAEAGHGDLRGQGHGYGL